jgi:hypothetical protein
MPYRLKNFDSVQDAFAREALSPGRTAAQAKSSFNAESKAWVDRKSSSRTFPALVKAV